MLKSFFNWLGAWLLATLFVFLAAMTVIGVIMLGAIFITWSLPEFNDIGNILFAARALLAVSAFIGFAGLPRRIGLTHGDPMALFNMSEPQFNAVKTAARAALSACKAEVEKNGYSDKATRLILDKHYRKVAPLISIERFVWLVGYLNNRWGTDQDYF